MTPKLKKIIITSLALVLMFVLYSIFIKADPQNDSLLTTGNATGDSDTRLLGVQISQALLRIEQIKLDKTIFSDNIYRSLEDRSVPIEQEPRGRANPFAPIGDISVVSITQPVSTSTPSATSTSTRATTTSSSTTTPVTPRTN